MKFVPIMSIPKTQMRSSIPGIPGGCRTGTGCRHPPPLHEVFTLFSTGRKKGWTIPFKLVIECRCRDVAQLGRALRSGRRSRAFKSRHPDHFFYSLCAVIPRAATFPGRPFMILKTSALLGNRIPGARIGPGATLNPRLAWEAPPWKGLPVFGERVTYPAAAAIWKMGRYMAMIIPPTTPPRKTIMKGSRSAVMAPTAASTSSS